MTELDDRQVCPRRVLNGTFESYTKLGQDFADSGTSMRSRLTAYSVSKAHIRTKVLLGYKNRRKKSRGKKIKYVIDPKYSHMVHLKTRLLGNGTERARPTLGTNLSYFSVSQIFLEGQENVCKENFDKIRKMKDGICFRSVARRPQVNYALNIVCSS